MSCGLVSMVCIEFVFLEFEDAIESCVYGSVSMGLVDPCPIPVIKVYALVNELCKREGCRELVETDLVIMFMFKFLLDNMLR